MAIEIEPVGELELWNRPFAGEVAVWVRCAILAATAITVALIDASADVLWRMDGKFMDLDGRLFRWGPTLAVMAVLIAVFWPASSTSRLIRLAILLPVVHVVALVVSWRLLTALDMLQLARRAPIGRLYPNVEVALVMLGATAVASVLIARHRREWLQSAMTIALGNLLVLGLWLPVACRLWTSARESSSWARAESVLEDRPDTLVISVVALPFVLACGYAALISLAPAFARRMRPLIAMAIGVGFAVAVTLRLTSREGGYLLYDNFIHIILIAALVAVIAVGGFALVVWRHGRRAARAFRGETLEAMIDPEEDNIVACLEITSWLRGPRLICRPFVATTPRGKLVVPGGVTVGLPPISSVLRAGEAVVVLRGGDRIELAGFVDRDDGDHPFRGSSLPIPGPRGIAVGRAGHPPPPAMETVGLATWRPAVAYLLIVIAIAIPGLFGVFAPTW